MHDQPNLQINLSRTKTRVTVERVIFKWVTKIGKLIIIITELIALGALAYRFTVDAEIVDLHDKIKKHQDTLTRYKGAEDKYRDLQTRLFYIKTITEESKAKLSLLHSILDSINKGALSTTNVIVGENGIQISGSSTSISSVNNFINTLKNDPSVDSISIDELSSIDQGVKVKIQIALKPSQLTSAQ